MLPALTKKAVKTIKSIVDRIFDRVRLRVLGPLPAPGAKKSYVTQKQDVMSIPDIYRHAAAEEAAKPNARVIHSLVEVAGGYLEAERERTKARVLGVLNAWMAGDGGGDASQVLQDELAGISKSVTESVIKIVDSTATAARNLGTMEGISKAAVATDVEDPTVFFIVVRDHTLCEECRRVHLLPDGVTPRAFKMSEVTQGFHKRGTDTPSIGGLHPHCRCTIGSLLPGYGFNAAGGIRFVDVGHDEYASQRG